jgi:type II secretory pathway pseudopilin PulG
MPRVQQKRGTAANLASVNPTPLAGELLVVTDENTLVIGNGSDSYTSLSYVTATPRDGSVTTAKIADDAVTYAKIQNVSATDRLLGRSSSGAGNVEEITCTAFGRSLIDDADAAAGRATLAAAPLASPTFTGVVTVAAGTAALPALVPSGDANTGFLFPAADTVAISTAGGERVRVDSGGRVGLSYSTPSDFNQLMNTPNLVVGGGSNSPGITIYSGTGNSGTLAFADGTTTTDQYRGAIQYNHSLEALRIFSGSAERVRVKSTGSVRFFPLAADPASGNEAGDVYYNSANNKLRVYNGTSWVDLH